MLTNNLPQDWQQKLRNVLESKSFEALAEFVEEAYETTEVFPPKDQVWQAFQSTPYDEVKVVILGQDPYHDHGQAHGLSFSVKEGVKIPPSLRNMYKELASDLQIPEPQSGNLQHWADQGILLLNTVLTVEAHKAHSHKGRGWEVVTDELIRQLNNREKPVIFVLWGKPAQRKKALIDTNRHFIIENVHPSPLSAYRGFFGSKPYSAINNQLMAWGQNPIDFNCPNDEQLHLQL